VNHNGVTVPGYTYGVMAEGVDVRNYCSNDAIFAFDQDNKRTKNVGE